MPLVRVYPGSMLTSLTIQNFAMVQLAHICDYFRLAPGHIVVLRARRTIITVLVPQEDNQILNRYMDGIGHLLLQLGYSLAFRVNSYLFTGEGVGPRPVIIHVFFMLHHSKIHPV